MKKVYALLLVAVMTVAMAVPTFAANSPEADPVVKTAAGVDVVAAAKEVKTSVAAASVAVPSEQLAKQVVSVTSTESVLKDLNVPTSAKLVAAVDVSYSGEIPAGGVQLPYKVPSAKKGDMVYVLHRQPNAPYTWEVVGSGVLGDDLTVTGTFTSFSPVAFMVVDAADVAATAVKAPKTGEFYEILTNLISLGLMK